MVKIFKASNKKPLVGTTLTLNVERIDNNGLGVAYYKEKPVFVSQSLPFEQVKAKVVEEKSKYLKAKLLSVEKSSEYRSQPQCKHFSLCGGCDLQHITPEQQRVFKQDKVSQLFARQGIEDLPWQAAIFAQPWGYRRKARIGVQYNKKGEAIIGFRQRQSNDITSIKRCEVLEAPIADIFIQLRSVLSQLSLHKSIGHIEVFSTDKITLVIRQLVTLNEHDSIVWQKAMKDYQWQLFIDDGQQLSPLQAAQSNLSEQQGMLSPLQYDLNGALNIQFRASDFIQVNHEVNKKMVQEAVNWLAVSPDDNVLDLFCGLGNFSVAIAQQASRVLGVEGVEAMTTQAQNNATLNGLDNCQFFHANLNEKWDISSWSKERIDKILLDPARSGALEACQQLLQLNAQTIVYVSCDPATLARDSKILLEGGYRIEKIAIIDMFSQTKHVETMVLFQHH